MGRTLRRSIRRQVVSRLLVVLTAFTIVALVADLVTLADLLVSRGLGAGQVGRVALLRLVPVLGASIPLALLFAILISIGRMRAHGELGALQSCGVSPLALLRPVLWTALALTAVGLLLSLWLAPRASRQLNADMLAAATTRPAAVLRSGVVSYFGDLRVQAREVSSDGANLRGVVAWIPSLGGSVFAKRAKVISGDEGASESSSESSSRRRPRSRRSPLRPSPPARSWTGRGPGPTRATPGRWARSSIAVPRCPWRRRCSPCWPCLWPWSGARRGPAREACCWAWW
jgi:lipopolysaccharide export LptBFGC system permease protein LptF